jgi:antirestriction protein ArdC
MRGGCQMVPVERLIMYGRPITATRRTHKRWGDDGYALEELVAELGSAFLCADLQITPGIGEDHAGYIHEWLKVLKEDKRVVFTAASHQQGG